MKKLLPFVLLAIVACAPGQGAQSVTAPAAESNDGRATLGTKSGIRAWSHACDLGDAIPSRLVCDMAFLQEQECCQACTGGAFVLHGTCP